MAAGATSSQSLRDRLHSSTVTGRAAHPILHRTRSEDSASVLCSGSDSQSRGAPREPEMLPAGFCGGRGWPGAREGTWDAENVRLDESPGAGRAQAGKSCPPGLDEPCSVPASILPLPQRRWGCLSFLSFTGSLQACRTLRSHCARGG